VRGRTADCAKGVIAGAHEVGINGSISMHAFAGLEISTLHESCAACRLWPSYPATAKAEGLPDDLTLFLTQARSSEA
jgi:hypothetical protein